MSCTHTVSLGAYLLGALDPAERSAFEVHLRTCATCRREMVRLAPLPGLLAQVDLADLDVPFDDPVPDPDLLPLPPVAAPEPPAPRRTPTRRRTLVLLGAGLVAVLVAVGVLVFAPAREPDPVHLAAADSATGVSATADLVAKEWGTEMWLTIKNAPKGKRCKLVVHDRAGRAEIGGWWGTDHPEDARIPGSTSFAVDQIERLEVVVDTQVLVSVRP
ncbi:anti-sigma factor family protein [Saccharothrix variisporea]|uniref:Putative zinc finger protein n=1 Tax=Saccharothrix variisporea TaxID=543527 RepID=A0A495XIM7_9PSEU|nr:zf-HC2 domain-containing protein [Saccharothrix variisporea]RKT72976.1 putative zinc finger protein [Saccharothrix variisporea]